jgi:hypothetical protein
MSVSADSRYVRCQVIRVVNTRGNPVQPDYLDLEPPIETDQPDNQSIVVGPGATWPNLGWSLLQDPRAWWAIAEFSGVVDPFEELEQGQVLTVPSIPTYHFTLMGNGNG